MLRDQVFKIGGQRKCDLPLKIVLNLLSFGLDFEAPKSNSSLRWELSDRDKSKARWHSHTICQPPWSYQHFIRTTPVLKSFSPMPFLEYSCWRAAIITPLPIKVFYLGPARAGDKVTCWDGVVVSQLLVVPLPLLTYSNIRRLWRLGNPAVALSGVNAEWMTMIPQEWNLTMSVKLCSQGWWSSLLLNTTWESYWSWSFQWEGPYYSLWQKFINDFMPPVSTGHELDVLR